MKILIFLLLNVILSRNLLNRRKIRYRKGVNVKRRTVKRRKNNLLTKEASRLAHAT